MRGILDLRDGDPETLARLARWHIQGLILQNRIYLHRNPDTPKLYESGVRFRAEPWAGRVLGLEYFAPLPVVYAQGWGDCLMLSAIRCAELQHDAVKKGMHPKAAWLAWQPKIYWRIANKGTPEERRLFHVQVRHPPRPGETVGPVEDVSRYLEY